MKLHIFTKMSQQNPTHKEINQQHQPMMKPDEWSMDLTTSICEVGNGQNALKLRKLEVIKLFSITEI
jgi:hypothetical protein